MANALERLLLMLAASGMTEKEIYMLRHEIDRLSPSQFTAMVIDTRRHLRELPPDFFGLKKAKSYSGRDLDSSASDEAMRLLFEDARMPVAVAVRNLKASLVTGIAKNQKIPPFRTKEGVRSWIETLARSFGASFILHHATRVRNAVVHDVGNDWPLRDRSK
jgi:hypothetical protein